MGLFKRDALIWYRYYKRLLNTGQELQMEIHLSSTIISLPSPIWTMKEIFFKTHFLSNGGLAFNLQRKTPIPLK